MKQSIYTLALLWLAVSTTTKCVVPYINAHSSGVHDFDNLMSSSLTSADSWYRVLGTGSCEHLLHAGALTSVLFGKSVSCNGCPSNILIQGARFQGGQRDPQAWLADYFGLPQNFSSVISVTPSVKNSSGSFQLALGKHQWFLSLYAPWIQTTWHLDAQETVKEQGTGGYEAGYFAASPIDRTQLLPSALSFFSGTAPDLNPDDGSVPSVFMPLACARWCARAVSHEMTKGAFGDVVFHIGAQPVITDYETLALYARVSVPGGNKPQGYFLFEPVVGNGGHWGLGAGAFGQITVWQSDKKQASWALGIDGYLQHLFSVTQQRFFDIKNKPNSRYMLAQQLGTKRLIPSLNGQSDAGVEFQNVFTPVANLTWGSVSVSVPVEGELTLYVQGETASFRARMGYSFWGRSGEALKDLNCRITQEKDAWALKGDAFVVGFADDGGSNWSPVRLAAVQDATLESGTNNTPNDIFGVAYQRNPGILNRAPATTLSTINTTVAVTAFPIGAGGQTGSSNPVDFITYDDIDLAGTRGISHTFFTEISYTYLSASRLWPFILVGAQAELGKTSCCVGDSTPTRCGRPPACCPSGVIMNACGETRDTFPTTTTCSKTRNQECALSFWKAWATFGVQF